MDIAPEILPYCIFHRVSADDGSQTGYIGPPSVTQEGKYECLNDALNRGNLYGHFYAVSPILRPMPLGMQLYCALRADSAPYSTVDVKMIYDLYNRDDAQGDWGGCTVFMAYTQPVPNTVPLYLHKRYDALVPSFDKNPPTNNDGWGKASGGSPIYVMTPESVDKPPEKMNDVKFKCVSGRCLPWVAGKYQDVFGAGSFERSLRECLVTCDEIPTRGFGPTSALDVLQRDSVSSPSGIPYMFKKVHPLAIGCIVALFVAVLAVVMILMNRK